MTREMPDYSEDDRILARLTDPLDVEAFSNLMEHAHGRGMSAADFVREEPKRTSRRTIRKLCLKNRKRALRVMFASVFRNLWERPAEDPEGSLLQTLYGAPMNPPRSGRNGHRGKE